MRVTSGLPHRGERQGGRADATTGWIRLQKHQLSTPTRDHSSPSRPGDGGGGAILQQYPSLRSEIGGHTDDQVGASQRNAVDQPRGVGARYLKQNSRDLLVRSTEADTGPRRRSRPTAPRGPGEEPTGRNSRCSTRRAADQREKRGFLPQGRGACRRRRRRRTQRALGPRDHGRYDAGPHGARVVFRGGVAAEPIDRAA